MRRERQANHGTGERARAGYVRRATGMVVLAVLVFVVSAAATPVDDLLFDLRFAPLDSQPAPQFTLAGLDGKPVSLHQFNDHVVLLYFWATW
jgi:cytochrome oxidase Cu insertion factor (SCO1/SenC/PrrC family)